MGLSVSYKPTEWEEGGRWGERERMGEGERDLKEVKVSLFGPNI